MDRDSVKPMHVFIFLSLFWLAWLYSEITEYLARQDIYANVQEFMSRGDRFTADDGRALDARIERLEKCMAGSENLTGCDSID